MIPYKIDYTIEKITGFSNTEQQMLKQLTGKTLDTTEARQIWSKVQDHKWYVSERLGRDVGFRVAAIDFVENFYPSNNQKSQKLSLHYSSQPNALSA